MLIAREFTKNDELAIMDMVDEINEYDANFEGLNNLSRITDFEEFLQKLEDNKYQERIKPEYSPQTTFGIFLGDRLIGGFNLRHVVKGNLINHGGNIGYLIRPSARGKGYGKQMLRLAIKYALEIFGAEKITLGVFDNNDSAYGCYKAVGFEENGEEMFCELFGKQWRIIEMEM